MEKLFDKTVTMLSSMLDYHLARNEIIASNIANIDTPNYTSKDIVFKKELDEIMRGSSKVELGKYNEKHLSGTIGSLDADNVEVVDSGKKVDIDKEMGKLAENHLMYNLTVDLLARKFRGLNTVLREAK